ncbi:MAG: CRTAC1 family protein [Planctomycetes bacterium]|nr:CRTAC1 family protein [Planctomycetota bacterium]
MMSRLVVIASFSLLLFSCEQRVGTESPEISTLFTDVAQESGLSFIHESGAAGEFLLPEIMAGGAGFFDYDGDGFLDIYLVQSGHMGSPDSKLANRLYRNTGDGHFVDVTESANVGNTGYGMGCAAGDYDNDGDIDLYITNLGANVFYVNNGDGTFTDATIETATAGDSWSTSAAFVDYDADGDLDLFVTNYVNWENTKAFTKRKCFAVSGTRDYCSPQAYAAPSFDRLYRNDLESGKATFVDVSQAAGIRDKAGTGLGVVCTDLNNDGNVDIYVANDQMPSFAWINDGQGHFTEQAVSLGIAVDHTGRSQAGMGVDSGDIDGDGDFDLWKVHLMRESHILYINQGEFFDDKTIRWGLASPTRRFTGFGTAMFDFDLDGLLDVFIANGRVQYEASSEDVDDPYAEPNQLLRQVEPGRFIDITSSTGAAMKLIENSRAAAFGDYDNDGDIDILIANRNGPVRLLRNDVNRRGAFLTLRVIDRHGRDAYGAIVKCVIGETTRSFEVRAAYSYCATNDPRVHIGLGEATSVERVEVLWPDGHTESFGPFEKNTQITIRQSSTAP